MPIEIENHVLKVLNLENIECKRDKELGKLRKKVSMNIKQVKE